MDINIDAQFWQDFSIAVSETVTEFIPLAGALIAIPLAFYILRKIILLFPKH